MSWVKDWNVVITVPDEGYTLARQRLAGFGAVGRTDFFNVLVMQVADIPAFLEDLREYLAADPDGGSWLGRVVPLTALFEFHSAEEFEQQAREAVRPWADAVRGKRFHVRMHRRGLRDVLSSQHEEQFLDHFLLEETTDTGSRIDFEDPDVIIALETVRQRGGASCWTREQMQRYPFLGLD